MEVILQGFNLLALECWVEGKSDIIAFIMLNYEMKKWKVN